MNLNYLFFLLIITICPLHSQEISLNKSFDWKTVEKNNPKLLEDFINSTPDEFDYYKQEKKYYPNINDLKNDLHVIDLNNDNLDDIVFDGYTGGEPREISFFINTGKLFEKIFSDLQGISKMEFNNNVLSKLIINDWGCCGEFVITQKEYDVFPNYGILLFELKRTLKYIDNTELPTEYWLKPKTIEVLNDKYNLRYSPTIDKVTESFYSPKPTYGNIIGNLSKGVEAIAIGESTDETGRIWFFVSVLPKYNISNSYFYDIPGSQKSYKCGWVSSRFVKIKTLPNNI